jgi:hypothetical protein
LTVQARLLLLVGTGALVLAAQPGASIFIGTSPLRATLGVDSSGAAVVTRTQDGARQAATVPANALVVRRTSDGRTWALQVWPETPGGPVDLTSPAGRAGRRA